MCLHYSNSEAKDLSENHTVSARMLPIKVTLEIVFGSLRVLARYTLNRQHMVVPLCWKYIFSTLPHSQARNELGQWANTP